MYYHHDGEQLGFIKRYISKHTQAEQKEGCACNLCIARNEESQFI